MGYMKASKEWGPCCCNCGKSIGTGAEFSIVGGSMYLRGHESKATGAIPVVKNQKDAGKRKEEEE